MLGFQGEADDGARLPLSHFVNPAGEALVVVNIRDNQAFTVAGDPAGNPLSYLKPHIFKALRGIADGDGEVQFVPLFVHHEQRPGIRTEVFRHFFHNGLQDGIQVQGRGQGLGNIMENTEFLEIALALGARGLGHHSFLKSLQRGWAYYRQRFEAGATNLCNPRTLRANSFPSAPASGRLDAQKSPSAERAVALGWHALLPSNSLFSQTGPPWDANSINTHLIRRL